MRKFHYLQMLIHFWNKLSKCKMSQCFNVEYMDFQSIPLHMVYNFQHFEQIEYFNGVPWSLYIFQTNHPKVIINLNEFPYLSKSTMQ